jgi:hypothetical protein
MREGQARATNNGNVPRGSGTLSGAPNWLAAESVSATECLHLAARWECKHNANGEKQICAENGAVRECAYVDCHNDCPAVGMDDRMWAQLKRGAAPGK